MRTRRMIETALDEPLAYEELIAFLERGRFDEMGAVLIGGQAVALWVERYSVPISPAFQGGVSADVDFLGGIKALVETARTFNTKPIVREDRVTDFGLDNAGQVVIAPFGRRKALLVEFLYAPIGMNPSEVNAQAVRLTMPDRRIAIRVMHPIHCLESRLLNLLVLPAKRDDKGIQQARLAARVSTYHIRGVIDAGATGERAAFPLVERVFQIACSEAGCHAACTYGIDALDSIPVEAFANRSFRTKRHPQMQERVRIAIESWMAARSTLSAGRSENTRYPSKSRGSLHR